MKNCVYRFLNKDNEIIYIGKAKNLSARLSTHTHLPKECYDEKVEVEYIEFKTEDDMGFAERYYIMKFNPKYNTILSDKDFNLKSIDLDIKVWKKYSEKEIRDINFCEEVESLESLMNELKEVQIRIDTLRDFDLIWDDKTNDFNKSYSDLVDRQHNLEDKIRVLIEDALDRSMPEWIAQEFIDNCVYSIKELIATKLKQIEDNYYIKCKEQILKYGYYKEEIYESIDMEFVCHGTKQFPKNRWKRLLDGTEVNLGMEDYRINKDLKNNTVRQIIDNIEHRLYVNYGESEKEVILLSSCAEHMKCFYPDYDYMLFNKPFVVYKFNV